MMLETSVCLIPALGRSPGVGNVNTLQYSCLENSMDRILVGYSPWSCKQLDMTEQQLLSSLAGWKFRKRGAVGVAHLCQFSLVSALGHAHPSLQAVLL